MATHNEAPPTLPDHKLAELARETKEWWAYAYWHREHTSCPAERAVWAGTSAMCAVTIAHISELNGNIDEQDGEGGVTPDGN